MNDTKWREIYSPCLIRAFIWVSPCSCNWFQEGELQNYYPIVLNLASKHPLIPTLVFSVNTDYLPICLKWQKPSLQESKVCIFPVGQQLLIENRFQTLITLFLSDSISAVFWNCITLNSGLRVASGAISI